MVLQTCMHNIYNDMNTTINYTMATNLSNFMQTNAETAMLSPLYIQEQKCNCRAALMTGIYPFKMGLQRGFGKRSPQVSLSFSRDWKN